MTDLRVAAIQLSSQDDLDKNLSRAVALIEEASAAGARLIVLPENFAFMGGADEDKRALAESLDEKPSGRIVSALSDAARRTGVVRGRGRHARKIGRSREALQHLRGLRARRYGSPRAIARCTSSTSKSGTDSATARSASTTPGTEPMVLPVLGFQLGLSVCYDLRFPELYRKLVRSRCRRDRGARGVYARHRQGPLARALARARHRVAGLCHRCSPMGSTPARASDLRQEPRRRSVGRCHCTAGEGEGFVSATLSRSYVDGVRANLPSLRHRRL